LIPTELLDYEVTLIILCVHSAKDLYVPLQNLHLLVLYCKCAYDASVRECVCLMDGDYFVYLL
jgi:hypothetical protein